MDHQYNIPHDWEMDTLSNLCEIIVSNVDKKISEYEVPVFLCNYMDVYSNNYLDASIPFSSGSVTKEELIKFRLIKDDVIITKDSETPDDIAIPSVVVDNISDLVCGYHLAILRPKKGKVFGQFLNKALYTLLCRKHFGKMASGATRYGLSLDALYSCPILLPSIPDQKIIAEILLITDQAIEKIQQLIAKYERIKSGLITDLLSRGIDENGNIRSEETHEFKDSPLGRMPDAWGIKPIKDLVSITTGSSDTQDKVDHGQYPFFVRSQTVEKSNQYIFDGEGVLTSGDGVGVGKIYHYVNGKFDFHQRVYLMYNFVENQINGKYFYYYFKENFNAEVAKYSAKTTVDSVRLHMIADMLMPVPKYDEQLLIVSLLDTIESTKEKELATLFKYQSLKGALMQDLLTGKVRVDTLLKPTAELV